jgi:hypothetical protein
MQLTQQQLDAERRALLVTNRAGISLPVAGAIYWLALAICGYLLPQRTWVLVACFGSGAIFPLGLLLSRPLRSPLLESTSPLASIAGLAVLSINLLWPLHLVIAFYDQSLLPLALGIGMALHWPIIGWMYRSRTCLFHALSRTALVTVIWFLLPAHRLTLLPLTIAVVYAATVAGLLREVERARRKVIAEGRAVAAN